MESKIVFKTRRSFVVRIWFLFVRDQDEWVALIGIHDIDALVSQKSICILRLVWNQGLPLKRDELCPWIESSLFFRNRSSHWDTRYWCIDFVKKAFVLFGIKVCPLKWDELRPWIESSFFSWRSKTNGSVSLGYMILMRWFCK